MTDWNPDEFVWLVSDIHRKVGEIAGEIQEMRLTLRRIEKNTEPPKQLTAEEQWRDLTRRLHLSVGRNRGSGCA